MEEDPAWGGLLQLVTPQAFLLPTPPLPGCLLGAGWKCGGPSEPVVPASLVSDGCPPGLHLQFWHKSCFHCETCKMTLNMKNYKGYEKKPYCNA